MGLIDFVTEHQQQKKINLRGLNIKENCDKKSIKQPLSSSTTGFNRQNFQHDGGHEHDGGYEHDGDQEHDEGHEHDGGHHPDYTGYADQANPHHEYHEQHQYNQNPEQAGNQLLKFPFEKVNPFVNDNHHPNHKNSDPQFHLA